MDLDESEVLDLDAGTNTTVAEWDAAADPSILDVDTDTSELGNKCFVIPHHVRKALDLTDGKGSLLKLLQRCGTPQGARLMERWLIHPLTCVAEIEDRLELVELFVNSPSFRTTIADTYVKKFPDFAPLVKKLEKKRISLQDLYKIFVAVERLPALVRALKEGLRDASERGTQLVQEKFTSKLQSFYEMLSNYRMLVKQTVDVAYVQKTGEYRIRPDVTPELEEMSEQQEDLLERMKKDWTKLSKEVQLEKEKALKFEYDRRDGYLYRVTSKEEKKLRPHVTRLGLIRKKDKTSGFCFQTPYLKSLDAEYKVLRDRYEESQQHVMEELVNTAATFHEPCRTLNQIMAPLDVICALARVACEATIPYVRPKIFAKETGTIELIDSRHPCIESFLHKDFIANSVRFKENEERFHIVTGLNMGGKSTYVRQVALSIILAQMGSFVPCSSAAVSLVDGVYTRIGSGDSVTKGVSTFMMEMLETQDILKKATEYSLIIIDELGRGTSTYDGYGLAYAVAEHIATRLKSYCMFTTHFNELAELQKEVKSVVLSQVTAVVSEDGIVFRYQVQPGVSRESFGVNIARLTGMPSHVIQDSAAILDELEKTHAIGSSVSA